MNALTRRLAALAALAGLTLSFLAAGCDDTPPPPDKPAEKPKTVAVGPNVTLEVLGKQRRVLVNAVVCLRQGALEQFLTRKNTKEHEAILAADCDARKIHEALILAGATEGSTVKFTPKYVPASGSTIKVSVQYEDKGKLVTVPAQSWVKDSKTGKPLDVDWVFGGSKLVSNTLDPDKPKIYLANDGDVICVSNFDTAMLDLPIMSSDKNSELEFEAFTDRIPPLETRVVVILEPVPDPKKDK